jgi:hypothetical protein
VRGACACVRARAPSEVVTSERCGCVRVHVNGVQKDILCACTCVRKKN